MTISKGVLRIGGTIVGGTLGFLVMLRGSVASDPYLTMLFVVLFSFVFGLAGRTQYLCASLSLQYPSQLPLTEALCPCKQPL
jgi:uncharacterized membrane protein YccC